MRAMINPIRYRANRCVTLFLSHSESAIPIPIKVAMTAVITVRNVPYAIVKIYFNYNMTKATFVEVLQPFIKARCEHINVALWHEFSIISLSSGLLGA